MATTERVHPTVAGEAAVAKGKGTCRVCGREVATRKDGIPKRPHKRRIQHNHDTTYEVECYGSGFPVAEYVEAFEAAR